MTNPYFILEVANTHAGDREYVFRLLEEYASYTGCGIKFQPFKYDEIAREDYEWYPVYKTLFFDEQTWTDIIERSSKTKEVWIDVSNKYSVSVLSKNLQHIRGIKFQSSILDNVQLINELKSVDLSKKIVMINVAGIGLDDITSHLETIKHTLNAEQIILQVGFQNYPTSLEDSGLSKIKVLVTKFGLPLSFADHLEGTSEDALLVPLIAATQGVKIIEKHVMCSGEKAKYDHFSSVTPDFFKRIHDTILSYTKLFSQPFLNDNEKKYLEKTAMKPTVCRQLKKGQIISLLEDVNYKRTNADGIDLSEVKRLNAEFHVLDKDKADGEVLHLQDFRKAKIATIIAGRLKSTRLPQKAILKVGDITSVELCIKNALNLKNTDVTVLATSIRPDDEPLKDYTYSPEVVFHKGDPEDVIQRYLDIIDKLDIDVFIRVTADMPYLSNEIVDYLLRSHFETGADYTAPKKAAIGQGVQIINASALRKVREYFPVTDLSEYMNAYIIYNASLFKINEIDLPKEWIRDYRLTLDYPEDLELIRKIEEHFKSTGEEYNIRTLFGFLDSHPEIAAINRERTLIYQADPKLAQTIKERTTFNG